MDKQNYKNRFALTLIFSFVIFLVLLSAVLISGITAYILIQNGFISNIANRNPSHYIILFMVAISIVIGTLITLISSKIFLRPLNRLITQMNKLASGDFKARIKFGRPISHNTAFTEISNSFNKMAEELENTEMLRRDFINNFSHEFKTPIVSIAGFAKLLKRGNLAEEQKEEYLDIIEEESLRLSYMATNVLNLTKVENQTILTDISTFNLSEQIRSSVLLLENKWTKNNVGFELKFSEHNICANEELLKQVWINLIDNAVKFSPDGGTVEIKIFETDSSTLVTVINNSDEISKENQKRIFNKFYQADESHASEGNGIGLAIVKRVTELHGGKVSVKNKNKVTSFTVELPKQLK